MSVESAPVRENVDSARGFAFALAAYVLWGFLPFYMKAVAHIPPAEVIAHRIVWSVPVAGAVLVALGRTGDVKMALRTPRMMAMATLTAALITVNWGIYVWAIGVGRTLDTALGYFINPLFSILLGAVLLREKLSLGQKAAIGLAALGVVVLTVESGSLPWVSLMLTLTWGFYAFFRKTLPIGPNQGFFLEVLLLALPALAYIVYLEATGQGHLLNGTTQDAVLLLSAGVITAVPLIIYANGAKLLRLSTIGIMQYIAPTMIFLIAVFIFDEPFGTAKMIAFPLIWLALVVYSVSMLAASRRK
ncbi:MAG: permease [Rhizobiales bacterium 63-7]|uniref:EamA family transporter RarD n=1 Tax=Rhizobium sp. YJ-22 TaxID=3037556 RepID=UPI00092A8FAF|nr:EamA family transporter RarD [Rhizobium sp. YJ-22]MBN9028205.1 EamA family transporter RarD [Hyphomicrobiales bacterium]MDG3577296.1 EamA family transporter RarD [Rhizobium sp. YJ-22]OJU68810.1 MAG: permease [Rhizobiales bacterium 63-7]